MGRGDACGGFAGAHGDNFHPLETAEFVEPALIEFAEALCECVIQIGGGLARKGAQCLDGRDGQWDVAVFFGRFEAEEEVFDARGASGDCGDPRCGACRSSGGGGSGGGDSGGDGGGCRVLIFKPCFFFRRRLF